MEIRKLEGIVLTETNYGDSSKILNVFTKELGIVGIMSKGCRKLKSPLRSVSSKLTYGTFIIYYKEKGLSLLKEVDIINSFKNILTDITKISYSNYILELTSQVSKQNNDIDIYNYCISSLKKINEGFDPLIIMNILRLKYLKYLGVDINIDNCNICGNTNDIVTLSTSKGGYICKSCYDNERILDNKVIKVIRLFYYVDIDKISKLELSMNTIKEIDNFMDDYYEEYTGLYLKSKNFLKIINKV